MDSVKNCSWPVAPGLFDFETPELEDCYDEIDWVRRVKKKTHLSNLVKVFITEMYRCTQSVQVFRD